MKHKTTITVLVVVIAALSLIASAYAVSSGAGGGQYHFTSIHGQEVLIHGKGLYYYDSVSLAAQGIGQDLVTLFMGIPILLVSLFLARKGLLKGRLILTGTLAYFLYTYASYSFLLMYNQFFLVYVVLMSASFFAFTLAMMSFDLTELSTSFGQELPVRFIGGFLIFVGVAIGMMWLGMTGDAVMRGTAPEALEHYTTLVIQAMDLGFIVPTAFLAGILVIRRRPYGYLLAPVIIIKGITMATAITAMIVAMIRAGVVVSPVQIVMFPAFALISAWSFGLLLRHLKEPGLASPAISALDQPASGETGKDR